MENKLEAEISMDYDLESVYKGRIRLEGADFEYSMGLDVPIKKLDELAGKNDFESIDRNIHLSLKDTYGNRIDPSKRVERFFDALIMVTMAELYNAHCSKDDFDYLREMKQQFPKEVHGVSISRKGKITAVPEVVDFLRGYR